MWLWRVCEYFTNSEKKFGARFSSETDIFFWASKSGFNFKCLRLLNPKSMSNLNKIWLWVVCKIKSQLWLPNGGHEQVWLEKFDKEFLKLEIRQCFWCQLLHHYAANKVQNQNVEGKIYNYKWNQIRRNSINVKTSESRCANSFTTSSSIW